MISKGKIVLLELGARMEVGYSRDYSYLIGSRELTADRKRLSELCRDGVMVEAWRNGRKIYYLSQKGLSIVETHMKKPYNPKGYTTDHALYVSELAAYTHLKTGISIKSFIFDREMEFIEELKPFRKYSGQIGTNDRVHAPDFIVGNRCYEIELNNKTKAKLKENFSYNSKFFDKQIWLVPGRLKTLQNNLKKLAEECKCQIQIITIEEMEEFLKNADPTKNKEGRIIDIKIKALETEKDPWEGLT